MPIGAVRAELERITAHHPLWDGRVCKLHVTDSKETTFELSALVSTRNGSAA